MRKLLDRLAWVLCILLAPVLLPAQNQAITGKVTDANLTPLAGVSITVDKTTNGTITDADGKFNLSAPANSRIVISLTGYKTQSLSAGSENN